MPTIKLLSWHDDVKIKAASLKRRGLQIDAAPLIKISSVVGELARLSPSVLVLDLDKVPSRSREVVIAIRTSKAARHIPILFAGGVPDKIDRLRTEFPDIKFAPWPEAQHAIAALLQNPPATPPKIPERDYSATSLSKKLGIREDMRIALLAAPDGFEEILGDLPPKTTLTPRITTVTNLALCFIRSLDDLAATLEILTLRLPRPASAWIIYPKRSGRHRADFNENHVRDQALTAGLVDYKVCSVDADWSALKFAHRKPTH
jgi:hypothetical protein